MFDVEGLCRLKRSVLPKIAVLAGCFAVAGVPQLLAQGAVSHDRSAVAQIVALDECEPNSFNQDIDKGGLGPDFCECRVRSAGIHDLAFGIIQLGCPGASGPRLGFRAGRGDGQAENHGCHNRPGR